MPMVTVSPSTCTHSCSSVYCSAVWSVMGFPSMWFVWRRVPAVRSGAVLLRGARVRVAAPERRCARPSGRALVEGQGDDGCRDARAAHIDEELRALLGD